jgi:preprotein translocase subunit SecA
MNLNVVVNSNEETENKKEDISKQISKNKKIGRNEPCFCGSGKKFKHCHGTV